MTTIESESASLVPSQAMPSDGSNRGRRRRGGGRPSGAASEPKEDAEAQTPSKRRNRPKKPKDSAQAKADPKSKKTRGKRKKYPWRRHIPPGSMDPITLENLVSLPYEPFALVATPPYVPVPVWPVPEDKSDASKESETEKMTPEEWQRRIIEEQWGQAVLPATEEATQEESKESSEARHYNLFDGRALAYYLVSQLQFIDPFNRRDLTRDELVNLDSYLVRHGFTDIKVVDAYDAKGVNISKAGAVGATAAGRASILQQEAQVLLNAMFGGTSQNRLQQQYAASQRQQHGSAGNRRSRRANETEDSGIYGTDDGGLIVIDDDANPGLRGRGVRNATSPPSGDAGPSHAAAPNTLWSASHITSNYSHSARRQAQSFPALPTPSAPTTTDSGSSTPREQEGKGPSRSLQRITKVVAPTNPAELKRQKEAREEAQRRAALSNLSFVEPGTAAPDTNMALPGTVPVGTTASGPTEGQLMRNQAMASALGVAPATVRRQLNAGWARPSEGALELDEFGNELNAALYPDSLILAAREKMEQLLKLERRWKTFLADDASASLPLRPMDRELRTFVHEYSDYWKLHTESFDPEPKRYIHCVKLRDTSAPVPLLSDAARRWRGPSTAVPLQSLPRGPRETLAESDHTSKQTAGQATLSREFPPAPPREPLKLKPRSIPVDSPPQTAVEEVEASANADEANGQLSTRFNGLFTDRERPKLALAPRSVPLELPPYQPAKTYNVAEERERQKAAIAEKAQKEREKAERKAKILENAFASSDDDSLASAGSSDWGDAEEQYSGSEDDES